MGNVESAGLLTKVDCNGGLPRRDFMGGMGRGCHMRHLHEISASDDVQDTFGIPADAVNLRSRLHAGLSTHEAI